MAAAVEIDAEIQQQLTNEVKLFNRWTYDDVSVTSSPFHSPLHFNFICSLLCVSVLASVVFD